MDVSLRIRYKQESLVAVVSVESRGDNLSIYLGRYNQWSLDSLLDAVPFE